MFTCGIKILLTTIVSYLDKSKGKNVMQHLKKQLQSRVLNEICRT
jgi:flagellar motor switch protein FliG